MATELTAVVGTPCRLVSAMLLHLHTRLYTQERSLPGKAMDERDCLLEPYAVVNLKVIVRSQA
jgi:hypothetical protein